MQLNNELRRETDKAREDWWRGECDELEELDKRGRTDLMYTKVKQITRTGKSGNGSSSTIKDRNGALLTEPEEVKVDGRSTLRNCILHLKNQSLMKWE